LLIKLVAGDGMRRGRPPKPFFSYLKLIGLMAASMGLGMLLIIIIPSWSVLLAALLILVGGILYMFC
jgi:hypothetical protein